MDYSEVCIFLCMNSLWCNSIKLFSPIYLRPRLLFLQYDVQFINFHRYSNIKINQNHSLIWKFIWKAYNSYVVSQGREQLRAGLCGNL